MSTRSRLDASFVAYLRRVGEDYAELGAENTARDYRNSADRIEKLSGEVDKLRQQLARVRELSPDTARLAERTPHSEVD